MRELKIGALVCGFFLYSALSALPIGNPAEPILYSNPAILWNFCSPCSSAYPEVWGVQLGYSGNFVYNRNLRTVKSPRVKLIQQSWIRHEAAVLAYNIQKVCEIWTTLGTGNIYLEANERCWGTPFGELGALNTSSAFAWSVGARTMLLQWNCFILGIEGEYFRTTPRFTSYDAAGLYTNDAFFNDHNQATYSEWQIGIGLAYTVAISCPSFTCTPYIGVKGSRAYLDTHHFHFNLVRANTDVLPLTIYPLISYKHWGYAIGATLTFCRCIGLTAEGRWGDEKAVHINGQIVF